MQLPTCTNTRSARRTRFSFRVQLPKSHTFRSSVASHCRSAGTRQPFASAACAVLSPTLFVVTHSYFAFCRLVELHVSSSSRSRSSIAAALRSALLPCPVLHSSASHDGWQLPWRPTHRRRWWYRQLVATSASPTSPFRASTGQLDSRPTSVTALHCRSVHRSRAVLSGLCGLLHC